MATIELNEPLQLQGRSGILIQDEISEHSVHEDPVQALQAGAQHRTLWARESVIRELNSKHPGVPIYGFWQTLLASRVIQPASIDTGLLIIEGFNAAVYVENGLAQQSGFVVADGVTFPCPLSIHEATTLNLDAGHLAFPSAEILHPAEAARRRLRRSNQLRAAALMTSVPAILLGWLLDHHLAANAAARQVQIAQYGMEQQLLTAKLAQIQAERVPDRDLVASRALTMLYRIVRATDGLEIKATAASSHRWRATALAVTRSELPPGVTVFEQQTGVYLLEWGVP